MTTIPNSPNSPNGLPGKYFTYTHAGDFTEIRFGSFGLFGRGQIAAIRPNRRVGGGQCAPYRIRRMLPACALLALNRHPYGTLYPSRARKALWDKG